MGLCVESGDFKRPSRKPDVDFGKFTVQCADFPLTRRKKAPKTKSGHASERRKRNARLTPISESTEELLGREETFTSTYRENSESPCESDVRIFTENLNLSLSRENSFERYETPINRKDFPKFMLDACQIADDELERICDESKTRTTEANRDSFNNLVRLPPRPKCKRKVLPPSVTNTETADKTKAKKLLKLRKRIESRLQQSQSLSSSSPVKSVTPSTSMSRPDSVSPLKDIRGKYPRLQEISTKNDNRPKSAESDVRIIRLADLAAGGNSASVPDLPSILSKLSDGGDIKRVASLDLDDNGALSTPRNAPEPPLTLVGWDSNCLKGSDMSSFYNMWERDRSKRPFGKKSKKATFVHRSCMCSFKKCADKLRHERGRCLPPITPAHG